MPSSKLGARPTFAFYGRFWGVKQRVRNEGVSVTVKPIQFKEFAGREFHDYFAFDRGNQLLDLRTQPAPKISDLFPYQPSMPSKPKAWMVDLSGQLSSAEKMRVLIDETLKQMKHRIISADIAHRLLNRRIFEDSQASKHARVKVIEHSEKLQQFMFETIMEKKQAQLALLKKADLSAEQITRELQRMGIERLDTQIATNKALSREAKQHHLAAIEVNTRERLNHALDQLAQSHPRTASESVHHNNQMLRIFSEEVLAKAAFLRAWNHVLAAHGMASLLAMQQSGLSSHALEMKSAPGGHGPAPIKSVIMTKV